MKNIIVVVGIITLGQCVLSRSIPFYKSTEIDLEKRTDTNSQDRVWRTILGAGRWWGESSTKQPGSTPWWDETSTQQPGSTHWWDETSTQQPGSTHWWDETSTQQPGSTHWWDESTTEGSTTIEELTTTSPIWSEQTTSEELSTTEATTPPSTEKPNNHHIKIKSFNLDMKLNAFEIET